MNRMLPPLENIGNIGAHAAFGLPLEHGAELNFNWRETHAGRAYTYEVYEVLEFPSTSIYRSSNDSISKSTKMGEFDIVTSGDYTYVGLSWLNQFEIRSNSVRLEDDFELKPESQLSSGNGPSNSTSGNELLKSFVSENLQDFFKRQMSRGRRVGEKLGRARSATPGRSSSRPARAGNTPTFRKSSCQESGIEFGHLSELGNCNTSSPIAMDSSSNKTYEARLRVSDGSRDFKVPSRVIFSGEDRVPFQRKALQGTASEVLSFQQETSQMAQSPRAASPTQAAVSPREPRITALFGDGSESPREPRITALFGDGSENPEANVPPECTSTTIVSPRMRSLSPRAIASTLANLVSPRARSASSPRVNINSSHMDEPALQPGDLGSLPPAPTRTASPRAEAPMLNITASSPRGLALASPRPPTPRHSPRPTKQSDLTSETSTTTPLVGFSTPVSSRLPTPVTTPRPNSTESFPQEEFEISPNERKQIVREKTARFGSAQRSSSRSGVVERITRGRFKGTTTFGRGSCGLSYPKIVKSNRSESGVES